LKKRIAELESALGLQGEDQVE
jgi:hypothetical protein